MEKLCKCFSNFVGQGCHAHRVNQVTCFLEINLRSTTHKHTACDHSKIRQLKFRDVVQTFCKFIDALACGTLKEVVPPTGTPIFAPTGPADNRPRTKSPVLAFGSKRDFLLSWLKEIWVGHEAKIIKINEPQSILSRLWMEAVEENANE